MSEERCVCCGEMIPEGKHVCPRCEKVESDSKKSWLRQHWLVIIEYVLAIVIVLTVIFSILGAYKRTAKIPEENPTETVSETIVQLETEETTKPPAEPETTILPTETITEPTEPLVDMYPVTPPYTDYQAIACIIYQEAGGDKQCDECRRRVADVVLNRVDDPRFPDTIRGVLLAKNQYGQFYYTGIKWPDRAKNAGEKAAVERAYRIAADVLAGNHSDLYGEGYIWQARFKQGKDIIYCCGQYYGR